MKKYLLLLLVSLSWTYAFPQAKTVTFYRDPAANPPDLVVTLKHITAHVSFNPRENQVLADAEFIFVPNRYSTDSIVFYAPDFTIKSVTCHSSPVTYEYRNPDLVIYTSKMNLEKGEPDTLKISYTAQPMRGAIYFIGWRPEEEGNRKEIWAHRPHGWLPYMDARITMDMYYTFDKNYKVFANGERVEIKDNADNTFTWHYRMTKDHPFFSTSVVIGEYDYKTAVSAGGVPMEFWYYRGMEDRVGPTYQYSEAMMDFFEKEYGYKYPYPIYRMAPVEDYMYGAMECTTATVFGDFMLIDPHAYWQRNFINTNAHELAHQWFGDGIAHLVNKDVWLTESFGTYYAKMFERSVFGEDHYRAIMDDERRQALEAAERNDYPVNSSMGGIERIYQKGSLVLGMLRYVMGDNEFRDAVKLYLERYMYGYAQTCDFLRCTYDATGKPYNWFFDQWILHGGEPEYKVSYKASEDSLGNRATLIEVEQVQDSNERVGFFRMPIVFEVHYKDGSADVTREWIENRHCRVTVPNRGKKEIDFILFDPNREVLKKVNFTRSFEELAAQLQKAKNMIDRYDALVAMRDLSLDQKRDVLVRSFGRETYHLVKSEIVSQLARDESAVSLVVLMHALIDPDPNVRMTALSKVTPIPYPLEIYFEGLLNDYSYLNQELALDNLCRSFPYPYFLDRILIQTQDLVGWRGMNIRMKWLEIAIGSGKKEYLPELIGYTSQKYEFETRMNAFNVLKTLHYVDEITKANASEASKHWNRKLSAAARDYISYFK